MRVKLKQDVLDKIKRDNDLFAEVGKALDLVPSSLTRKLYANDTDLTQKNVLIAISKHLDISEDDLFEIESEPEPKTTA